jgi:MFS family permease
MLHRIIAFPESRRVFKRHLLATPFLAVHGGVIGILPVLLRKDFDASKTETAIATAAIPVMAGLSIFWREVYHRVSPGRYLLIMWVIMHVPLAAIALCHRPETVLLFFVISATAFGGISAFNGDLLRSCYPPDVRGRVFGIISAVSQLSLIVFAYIVGRWLDVNAEAFRIYFPLGVFLLGIGVWIMSTITREPLFRERAVTETHEPLLVSLKWAVRRMYWVLKEDRHFRLYEAGFFLYGLGFMNVGAMLPFLVTDVLELNYTAVARSTQVALQVTLLIMMVPVGYLMGSFGPVRVASWAFALLSLLPIGLMLASGETTLTMAMVWYGIGMTGVQLAWTLGPVTLAANSAQAPSYLAIHTTLVAPRAILGIFPAVMLYRWTGRVEIPLILAMLLFAGGTVLMVRLQRQLSVEKVESSPEESTVGVKSSE